MARELARAIELSDMAAVMEISQQLAAEAQCTEFEVSADEISGLLSRGRLGATLPIVRGMARRSADLDKMRGELMGSGFLEGQSWILAAVDDSGL
jgi:hypothetical protein